MNFSAPPTGLLFVQRPQSSWYLFAALRGLLRSTCPQVKRPEFCAAGFAEVVKDIDGVLVDHLAQLKKCFIWLKIHIDDLLCDLLGAGEDPG